jgi:hypothetical protein
LKGAVAKHWPAEHEPDGEPLRKPAALLHMRSDQVAKALQPTPQNTLEE